ncbi:MAG: type II toxin-antitoxin system VapC family toxin [Reyranellales bacterium]
MTLLLDTQALIWVVQDNPSLGRRARRACDAALATAELAVPTVAFFELGELLKRERIKSQLSVRDWRARILSLGVREVPLLAESAMRATDLANPPGDPFDRLIVGTALVEQATLLTADQSILSWPGGLERQDATR